MRPNKPREESAHSIVRRQRETQKDSRDTWWAALRQTLQCATDRDTYTLSWCFQKVRQKRFLGTHLWKGRPSFKMRLRCESAVIARNAHRQRGTKRFSWHMYVVCRSASNTIPLMRDLDRQRRMPFEILPKNDAIVTRLRVRNEVENLRMRSSRLVLRKKCRYVATIKRAVCFRWSSVKCEERSLNINGASRK